MSGNKMKNIRLEIRLTEYESRQLEQEAVKRGMTKSELIRSMIARLPAPVQLADVGTESATHSSQR